MEKLIYLLFYSFQVFDEAVRAVLRPIPVKKNQRKCRILWVIEDWDRLLRMLIFHYVWYVRREWRCVYPLSSTTEKLCLRSYMYKHEILIQL